MINIEHFFRLDHQQALQGSLKPRTFQSVKLIQSLFKCSCPNPPPDRGKPGAERFLVPFRDPFCKPLWRDVAFSKNLASERCLPYRSELIIAPAIEGITEATA